MSTETLTPHPAKFTDAILEAAGEILDAELGHPALVLDPFAGTGKGVDFLQARGYGAYGIELEPEWATQSKYVSRGDALCLGWADGTFDAIFTSPCYGNRMADRDLRESVAGTYAKKLGRLATEGSACHLQWGNAYRDFHERAWAEAVRVLAPGGVFLLNCKDHVRGDQYQNVTAWHVDVLQGLGLKWARSDQIPVPGLRVGANSDNRVPFEWLVLLRKAA